MAERADAPGDANPGARARAALAPTAPLGLAAGALVLEEIVDRALVTIALPDDTARERLSRAFGKALPDVGESVVTDGGDRLLGLQHDRLYVMFEPDADGRALDAERQLLERLAPREGALDGPATDPGATSSSGGGDTRGGEPPANGAALLYSSDQSDAWCVLRLDGRASRRALERVCPLDLHPDVFPIDAVARSVVEHLGAIVIREGEDTFVLLSPRSSARSFLHEIETSVRHVRAAR